MCLLLTTTPPFLSYADEADDANGDSTQKEKKNGNRDGDGHPYSAGRICH
ncbi:MAG: hypothetical protein LRY40_05555 [Shewanella fodinae]|nr:hypothetical protein [Shewanella fodinae]